MTIKTRTDRIKQEYSNPNSREYNGQSTAKNIRKYAERAAENSIHGGNVGKFRATDGEIELPTGSMRESYGSIAKSGDDARRIGKQVNHSTRDSGYDASLAEYGAKNVRRQA
jgi:hypothetical protein